MGTSSSLTVCCRCRKDIKSTPEYRITNLSLNIGQGDFHHSHLSGWDSFTYFHMCVECQKYCKSIPLWRSYLSEMASGKSSEVLNKYLNHHVIFKTLDSEVFFIDAFCNVIRYYLTHRHNQCIEIVKNITQWNPLFLAIAQSNFSCDFPMTIEFSRYLSIFHHERYLFISKFISNDITNNLILPYIDRIFILLRFREAEV
jgi:hypothetical protein